MDGLINPTLEESLIFLSKHGDYLASLILESGHFWTAQDLPSDVQQGRLRECYWQARELTLSRPGYFTYVEGFAYSERDFCVPIQHAWCVDEYGNVVDPTWIKPSAGVYAGVPFKEEVIRRTSLDELEKFVQWGYLGTPDLFRKMFFNRADYLKPRDSYSWASMPGRNK